MFDDVTDNANYSTRLRRLLTGVADATIVLIYDGPSFLAEPCCPAMPLDGTSLLPCFMLAFYHHAHEKAKGATCQNTITIE